MDGSMKAILARIDGWGAAHAAAAVVDPDGIRASHGDVVRSVRWASVTKPITALAVLIAVERGLIDLDEPAGPPGPPRSTVRHLLGHASGLPFEGDTVLAVPGRRRIYSNAGFDVLGALVAERAGRPFDAVLRAWVTELLGMTDTRLEGRPSEGLNGPLADLAAFAGECLRPTLVGPASFRAAVTVAFPGLPGVVPGVGRYDACDWGLGFELHGSKSPHWMGERNSPATFGHFGGAGSFMWVDPATEVALVVITDHAFGPWALDVWPPLSDEVLGVAGH